MTERIEWPLLVDGRVVAAGGAEEPALDAAPSAFETIRFERGLAFELEAHLDRFERSCRALEIDWPLPRDVRADLARYAGAIGGRDAGLRVSASRGRSGTSVSVIGRALPELAGAGWSLALTGVRIEPGAPLAQAKTSFRAAHDAARSEARARGADDGLVTTSAGDVVETGVANIFVLSRGVLSTPPLARGALPGIARAAVLSEALVLGLLAREAVLTVGDLSRAEQVLATNALVRAAGVRAILGLSASYPGESVELPSRLRASLAARTDRATRLFFGG